MTATMNGAESLVHTLVGAGVDVCFTNPGTSEMHFVAALDRVPGMRCVLGLFEGVVTGMADGYGRMAGKPAATLLHLGPGLGNGIANLHNAQRAGTPIVNIVGEHATYHIKNNAPLTSDLEGIARPVSGWLRTSLSARSVAADAAEAVAAARVPPGRIATLILPGDTAWDAADGPAPALPRPGRPLVPRAAIESAAAALASDAPCGIVLGDVALREGPLLDAGRIAKKTGARLLTQSAGARWQRGAGRVPAERIAYPVDVALRQLAGLDHLLLIGAPPPVAFFAFPGRPGVLAPEGCAVHRLAGPGDDLDEVLARLAEALDATGIVPETAQREIAEPPASGPLTTSAIGAAIGALMPENAIVVDESVTTGRAFGPATAGSAPHDWLFLTGGAIGFGLPAATGAAIACPDRKVLCLEGDGSAMYTLQALWTQAREELDVVNIVFANRGYQILKGELANVGAGNPGRKALDMLEVDRPDLDFVALATGMGVPASRAETAGDFSEQLARALAEPGPHLIEAMVA